jgi:hypothetical protein
VKYRSKSERMRDREFAEGGTTKMFKPQAAGPDRPGNTGKDRSAAPGAKRAKGGPKNVGYGLALPAQPGRTAPARLGKGR